MNTTNRTVVHQAKFMASLNYLLLILILWIPVSGFSQKAPDQTFTIENYYRVKWGYADEFLDLYKPMTRGCNVWRKMDQYLPVICSL